MNSTRLVNYVSIFLTIVLATSGALASHHLEKVSEATITEFDEIVEWIQLGRHYYGGVGVPKDLVKALIYFKKVEALMPADIDALYYIAGIYVSDGELKDLNKAKSYFQMVAQQFERKEIRAIAQFSLGSIFFNERDYGQARYYLEEASKQPDSMWAQEQAGLLLKKLNEIVKWLKKGRNYYEGDAGVPKDFKRALKYFKKVEHIVPDDVEVSYYLGSIYFWGGELEALNKARSYFQKVAQQGERKDLKATAQFLLGTIFFNERDYRQARYYLEKASKQTDNLWAQGQAKELSKKMHAAEHKRVEGIAHVVEDMR